MSTPATQRALVLTARDAPLSLKTIPIPQATPGSAVISIIATSISPSARAIFSGAIPIPLILPLVPSSSAVGRIHAVGPDATALTPGQLVFVDLLVRGRDDPDASILLGYMGGHDAGSEALMRGEWRDGTFAEYAKIPLENLYALDEEVLVRQKGYSMAELSWLGPCFVNAGGLMEIDVRAGDTVIVAPATGYFGGCGVQMALAMGASVVAAARSEGTLKKMQDVFGSTGRFRTVKLTGDVEVDTQTLKKAAGNGKGADKYLDWSPPQAAGTKHIQACLGALRPFGRCVFMGAIMGNIEIPYFHIVKNSLRIQGRYMCDREHGLQAIKLLESGLLKLGQGEGSGIKVQPGFKMEDVEKALEVAETDAGWGNLIVLEP